MEEEKELLGSGDAVMEDFVLVGRVGGNGTTGIAV